MREAFFQDIDLECTSIFSDPVFLSRGLGILICMLLMGPHVTAVMARVMTDSNIGRFIGGTHNKNRNPDGIT